MSDTENTRNREGQRAKAEQFFKERETRKSAIYKEMETERSVSDAKTAKLRALRLAREAEEAAAVKPKKKTKSKSPSPSGFAPWVD